MLLTDIFIRGLKPNGIAQKHTDGGGLYLYVSPTGGRLWRLDYRFAGKRKTLSFGKYPAVSLKDARQKREEAKEQLAKGIDPGAEKKSTKMEATAIAKDAALTFKVVADEWLDIKKDTYAASNVKKKQWIIGLLYVHIGNKPISKVVPSDILAAIRPVEAAGHNVTAHKMADAAGQICRFARTYGYIVFTPAMALKKP